MSSAKPLGRLSGRRSITALVTAAMFTDAVFFALIAPLLPHYSDQLGLGQLEVGLLFAAHPFGTLACAALAARLVGRRGAVLTMTLGLISLGLATIVFGLTESLAVLLVCRFVQGASAAFVWCAGLARLQGIAPPHRRGAALGLAGSAAGAGSLFGPVFAALCSLTSVAGTLLVLGALSLALAATLFAAGELPGERAAAGSGEVGAGGSWIRPELLRPLALTGVCGTVFGAVATLAPLRLADLGAGTVAIAAAFALSALGEIVAAPFAGHLSDRVGRVLPLRLGLALAIPLLVVQALTGSVWAMAGAVALSGAAVASMWPLATALLADESSRHNRPAAGVFAASVVAWSGGLTIGSLLCGALASSAGDGVAYAVLAAVCALALLALATATEVGKPAPHPESSFS
jgi:MFS family permease